MTHDLNDPASPCSVPHADTVADSVLALGPISTSDYAIAQNITRAQALYDLRRAEEAGEILGYFCSERMQMIWMRLI